MEKKAELGRVGKESVEPEDITALINYHAMMGNEQDTYKFWMTTSGGSCMKVSWCDHEGWN
jgi:hypothetical protein